MTEWRRSVLILASVGVVLMLPGCGAVQDNRFPACRAAPPTVLMAQAVPGAQLIPCIRSLPVGWHVRGLDIRSGLVQFWLDSEVVGTRALAVVFTSRCLTAGAHAVESDEDGTRRLERIQQRRPTYIAQWEYLFAGGCVTYRFTFATTDRRGATDQIQRGLAFVSRRSVALAYQRQTGDRLDPPPSTS